ncbi:3-oxoacyl-(acyl-carrier-protein) reductase [Oceanicola granulosus HTCC2516]|uniref:3-oxoacyl-(Acyl-carrier-protein) reductase n=1 Tax=Oceanicola granulosus (strain ATCC BAA-861 / DSM 15982 / KCTC 12143 / HTCC2516) TaxID=314256 RepID=Q2CJB6_OCEGH|nr:SDR family oxidoreductase [Oceanicola granulosus]EAR52684.1 3-oxoacyl-(acyl-carrier-protein) reductase [Oceanicola granulosus HTCC2516]
MTAPASLQSLDGKVAVVTGASRRIGRATALGLARCGADVVVTARSARDEIEAVAREIEGLGQRAKVVMGDVSDEAEARRMGAEVRDAFGRVDVLVNNAAIRRQVSLLEMSFADWREIQGVILDGAFLMARELLPAMIETGGGTIVNIGGLTGHTGARERAHVCAAKAGLVGLTKAIAVEFADRGINANCLVPGKIGGARSATSGASPISADIPLGREGDVEEAAAMVVSLCLPQARFMTGQTVHVSGGLYMP